jgi:hypothetical protein
MCSGFSVGEGASALGSKMCFKWITRFLAVPRPEPGAVAKVQKVRSVPEHIPFSVMFGSVELVCLHEAGHAEVALAEGARVVEMELYRADPRNYGRTRVDRTELQRPHIALGGFAAEYHLYRAGRLIRQDGMPPTEKEFIDYAFDNAVEDKINFYGSNLAEVDGTWPLELDQRFMSLAIRRAETGMRFELIESIANALLASGKLDEAALNTIVSLHNSRIP